MSRASSRVLIATDCWAWFRISTPRTRINRTFLHTRFGLGKDVLEPYKRIIDRWLWPDAFRKQDTSVAKAKQAISNYKKAVGDPAGLAELMVFYSEQAAGFASDVGYQDESCFDAHV